MLFLDTEFFISRRRPQLLSLGLVTGDREFYGELNDWSLSRISGVRKNPFLAEAVLPQFGRLAHTQYTAIDLARATAGWLSSQGPKQIEVVYDYSLDFELLESLLSLVGGLSSATLEPVHVGYLLEDPDGIEAAERSWLSTETERSLHRHHALADALALRARFVAVHGSH